MPKVQGITQWLLRLDLSPVSERAIEDQRLRDAISREHQASHEAYGSPRIYVALKQKGVTCGRHRVARLMKCLGIAGRSSRLYRANAANHDFYQRHGYESWHCRYLLE